MSSTKLCIDLCAGMGGFSQAFEVDPEWEVVRIELKKRLKPTICADIRYLPLKEGLAPDALLMSPPCERNSIACPEWPKKGIMLAFQLVGACLEAVAYLKPKRWLLENPRGRLRWFLGTPRQTIRYSDYDLKFNTQKITDFWGNVPLPMVLGMRPVHVGHVDSHWFAHYMPRSPSERAKIPLGVSQAVKQGVESIL